MTELQAAIGLVQLGRLQEAVAHRREIVASYQLALARIEGLRPVRDPAYGTSNFQSFWLEVLPSFALPRRRAVGSALARTASWPAPGSWRPTGNRNIGAGITARRTCR